MHNKVNCWVDFKTVYCLYHSAPHSVPPHPSIFPPVSSTNHALYAPHHDPHMRLRLVIALQALLTIARDCRISSHRLHHESGRMPQYDCSCRRKEACVQHHQEYECWVREWVLLRMPSTGVPRKPQHTMNCDCSRQIRAENRARE